MSTDRAPGLPAATRRQVAVVADDAAAQALAPLLAVWRGREGVVVHPWEDLARRGVRSLATDAGALLVVGPRRRSPQTVLEGPVVVAPDGRVVPTAWLPYTTDADVARFAETAALVHRRAAQPAAARTLAVLGERHPRFDRLADRIVRIADDRTGPLVTARRCTAYEVGRDDLVDVLAGGPAVGLYVGHGRPIGWVGYAGLRAHHLAAAVGRPGHRPASAIVSLTCRTASRRRTGLSFAEALPLSGVAAASIGAVTSTVHTGNARWALRIARDLGSARTIGDLVASVAPHDPHAGTYRLMGDPTAPLLDAPTPEAPSVFRPMEEAS